MVLERKSQRGGCSKTMKHVIRIALFAGLILGVLQFIPVGQPTAASGSSSEGGSHLIKIRNPEVVQILNRSCADCHSSYASLPWYGHVAPVSWLIKRPMDTLRITSHFGGEKSRDNYVHSFVVKKLREEG